MLFRKKIDPRCAYCVKGTRISDEEVACVAAPFATTPSSAFRPVR